MWEFGDLECKMKKEVKRRIASRKKAFLNVKDLVLWTTPDFVH